MRGPLCRFNRREHLTIYALATVSNLLLSIAEYLAVRSAALSLVPLEAGTSGLVASYGVGVGLTLDFLWTLLIFQGLLTIIMIALAVSATIENGWRWVYVLAGMIVSVFVGYWIGVKFLRTLNWISILQNTGMDISSVYSELFWFGLGTSICYLAMILTLRRSYDRLMVIKNVPQANLVGP